MSNASDMEVIGHTSNMVYTSQLTEDTYSHSTGDAGHAGIGSLTLPVEWEHFAETILMVSTGA